jgi:serine/threonine protein kinase
VTLNTILGILIKVVADIKPANILIDRSCQPYLIDFGGAKVSEGEGGSTVAIGTLGFIPPEQRFQQFNKTTDIYSLGLSIHYLDRLNKLLCIRIKFSSFRSCYQWQAKSLCGQQRCKIERSTRLLVLPALPV